RVCRRWSARGGPAGAGRNRDPAEVALRAERRPAGEEDTLRGDDTVGGLDACDAPSAVRGALEADAGRGRAFAQVHAHLAHGGRVRKHVARRIDVAVAVAVGATP